MKKFWFYFLSFTWGLPMTLIGLITAVFIIPIMLISGNKPSKYGYCIHLKLSCMCGGMNLGIVILTSLKTSDSLNSHEHGHALQNCYWGFLFPFVIALPSLIRCWYRGVKTIKGKYAFAVVLSVISSIVGAIISIVFGIYGIWWLYAIGMFIIIYFMILAIWFCNETPKYEKGYVNYDDFWAEGEATKWGEEFIKSLGEK